MLQKLAETGALGTPLPDTWPISILAIAHGIPIFVGTQYGALGRRNSKMSVHLLKRNGVLG
jgi:hypothetical protein